MFYKSILLLLTDQISLLSHNTHLIFEEKVFRQSLCFLALFKIHLEILLKWQLSSSLKFILIFKCLLMGFQLQKEPCKPDLEQEIQSFQGLSRTFSYDYARARAPSCEKDKYQKSPRLSAGNVQ